MLQLCMPLLTRPWLVDCDSPAVFSPSVYMRGNRCRRESKGEWEAEAEAKRMGSGI